MPATKNTTRQVCVRDGAHNHQHVDSVGKLPRYALRLHCCYAQQTITTTTLDCNKGKRRPGQILDVPY